MMKSFRYFIIAIIVSLSPTVRAQGTMQISLTDFQMYLPPSSYQVVRVIDARADSATLGTIIDFPSETRRPVKFGMPLEKELYAFIARSGLAGNNQIKLVVRVDQLQFSEEKKSNYALSRIGLSLSYFLVQNDTTFVLIDREHVDKKNNIYKNQPRVTDLVLAFEQAFNGFYKSNWKSRLDQSEQFSGTDLEQPDSAYAHPLVPPTPAQSYPDPNIGVGIGLDYGGIGLHLAPISTKYLDVFGAVGYNFAAFGYNAGITFRPSAEGNVVFGTSIMYGYNGVLLLGQPNSPLGITNSQGSKVYYGPSFELSLDFHSPRVQETFFRLGLIVPVRSQEWKNDINTLKNNNVEFSTIFPVLISLGMHFSAKP